MTCHLRHLTPAAIVLGLLACADRAAPSIASPGTSLTAARSDVTAHQRPDAEVAAAIQAAISGDRQSTLEWLTLMEREPLARLYWTDAFAPLWVDVSGHANRDARDALRLLKEAVSEGLDPEDYCAPTLGCLTSA